MAKIVSLLCKLVALGLVVYVSHIYIISNEVKDFWALLGIGALGLIVSNFALSVDISKVLENVLKLKSGKDDTLS